MLEVLLNTVSEKVNKTFTDGSIYIPRDKKTTKKVIEYDYTNDYLHTGNEE